MPAHVQRVKLHQSYWFWVSVGVYGAPRAELTGRYGRLHSSRPDHNQLILGSQRTVPVSVAGVARLWRIELAPESG
jgi:hypothetical protein